MQARLLILGLLLSSCGAPVKNSDQVAADMDLIALDLDQKLEQVCTGLRSRASQPRLEHEDLVSGCAANQGSDLNLIAEGDELPLSSFEHAKSGDLLIYRGRSELWLNTSFFDLMREILPTFNSQLNNPIFDPDPDADITIEPVTDAQFDEEDFSLSQDFSIASDRTQNGFLQIANELRLNARLLKDENAIAATIITPTKTPFEASLIHNVDIKAILVPHAKDLYLSIWFEVELHSFGADEIVRQEFLQALKQAFRDLPPQLRRLKEGLGD